MGKQLLFLIFLFYGLELSAQDLIGRKEIYNNENGFLGVRTEITAEPNTGLQHNQHFTSIPVSQRISNLRWAFTDPAAIGTYCEVSGNGNLSVTGWDLNNERVSLYNNAGSTPVWEYTSSSNAFRNYVNLSEDGSRIAAGSYQNIFVFNNISATPIFNFDLTTLPDTGIAGPVDITRNGGFIVGCASRSDSSTIFGFNSTSNVPVWSFRIKPLVPTGGAGIQGIVISANDSVVIVNTYLEFLVFRTYTGQLLHRGSINNVNTSGTQMPQGISGNGSIIATINYRGALRVYQWNGSTYNFMWEHLEPPGQFFNWMTAVDITDDGQFISCGTLNFVTSSSFDGKVKVFKTSSGSTPLWTYTGAGDEVNAVSFSKSGNILSAASWGDLSHQKNDLVVFKTFLGNVPIYGENTPGSFFWCSTSNDGKTVVASGKAVHARQFGNGGLMYNVEIDTSDVPTSIGENEIASEFSLEQNYPNPFNPVTLIKFSIPIAANVKLTVYDAYGREAGVLVNNYMQGGTHNIVLDAAKLKLSSGVYFYTLSASSQSEKFTSTKKLILVK